MHVHPQPVMCRDPAFFWDEKHTLRATEKKHPVEAALVPTWGGAPSCPRFPVGPVPFILHPLGVQGAPRQER